jgi:uncharacterized protein YggT (Ycf19 family)
MTYRDPDETRVDTNEPARPYATPGSQVNVNTRGGGAAVAYSPGPLYYARRVVVLLFGILEVLIAIRILLLLLGANAGNALVDFVYSVTEPFVVPFRGIFAIDVVAPTGFSVFDLAALLALVGWVLIEALILAILSIADRDRALA